MSSSVNKCPSFVLKEATLVDAAREATYRITQLLYLLIHTSLYAMSDDWLNRPALDCHPREGPSGQLSVTRDATMSCIRDGHKTNAYLAFDCVRCSWESQKSRQIPRIRVMPGSAIPGRNRVVARYSSHLYCLCKVVLETTVQLIFTVVTWRGTVL